MTVLRTNTIAGIGETFGPLLDGDLEFNSQNYIVLPKGSSNQQGVLRTTEDVIGVGGTYYDNLVLAMPFNEATGFRDVSSRNRNPGAYGNVAISTAQSKYYGSSAYFDGSGDYLILENAEDFKLQQPFTIEMWVYVNSYDTGGSMFIHQQSGSTFGGFEFWADFNGLMRLNRNDSAGIVSSGNGAFTIGGWRHIAASHTGTVARIFVDGIVVASNTTTSLPYVVNGPIRIGNWIGNDQYDLNGYLQDLRIYKGLAKYTANFTPPERIAEIGVGFKTGALRYNTDSNKVELYDGSQWAEVQSSRPDLNGGARGLFGGSYTYGPSSRPSSNVIDYITISSTGNAIDFGDLTLARGTGGSCASSTRGVFGGGNTGAPASPGANNTIDYVTISSTGNAQDFGDLTAAREHGVGSCSSSTRGIFGGGTPLTNIIDFVTISSTGNAVDFGDLTVARYGVASFSSPVRGIFAGSDLGPAYSNVIDYITISTTGNAFDFGDLTNKTTTSSPGGCSNSTRGLIAGGVSPVSSQANIIDYITISTLGNSVRFGNLTTNGARRFISGASSATRGIFAGGYGAGPTHTTTNTIDYITILTQGDAVDFGDLTTSRATNGGLSNAHGGL
jgi:hypothetical protein